MGSYFNIVLISFTSFSLCPPASASIDSACLNQPSFVCDGWKMAILCFLHWVVDILQEKNSLLFRLFLFSYICRFSWIPILLWVVICYYHYLFWCSNCSHCGHWDPLHTGSCASLIVLILFWIFTYFLILKDTPGSSCTLFDAVFIFQEALIPLEENGI